jgi:hypothetical protein
MSKAQETTTRRGRNVSLPYTNDEIITIFLVNPTLYAGAVRLGVPVRDLIDDLEAEEKGGKPISYGDALLFACYPPKKGEEKYAKLSDLLAIMVSGFENLLEESLRE